MDWPFATAVRAWKQRRALPVELKERLDRLQIQLDYQASQTQAQRRQSLALARFVALDCETTGPDMNRDQLISIGAVAVTARSVRHDDAFEVVLQQEHSSAVDNILIHRIGGQEQLAGQEPAAALIDFLDWCGGSVLIAFRAEFDQTVLTRALKHSLGLRRAPAILDLAALLPAVFPARQNDSLDDWVSDFGLPPIGRHQAIADAYANAQLLLLVIEQASRNGLATVGELVDMERAQRWLGKRR